MKFTRRAGLIAAATTALALTLSACGGSADSAPASSTAAAGAAFPVSIKHIYGTTEITEKPERVATVSWVNADAVLALGVVPVAMAEDVWGNNEQGSTDWKDAKLAELGASIGTEKAPVQYSEADGVNFTALAEAQPDLIVAGYSGLTKDEYDKLSKIAPVIGPVAPNYTASWQDVTIGRGPGAGQGRRGQPTSSPTSKARSPPPPRRTRSSRTPRSSPATWSPPTAPSTSTPPATRARASSPPWA